MSEDLIRRSDAIKAVDAFLGTDPIVERIKRLPSADRPQGEWITTTPWSYDGGMGDGYYQKCSNCGKEFMDKSNFCPNCGADMRGKDDE